MSTVEQESDPKFKAKFKAKEPPSQLVRQRYQAFVLLLIAHWVSSGYVKSPVSPVTIKPHPGTQQFAWTLWLPWIGYSL
jgi:hypothetical protein